MTPPDDDRGEAGKPERRLSAGLVIGAIMGALLALFVVQNTRETPVKWLFFEATQPLWVVLVVTAAASLLAAELIGGARRRRKRKGR